VATVNPAGAPGSPTPGSPTTVKVPGQWLGPPSVLPVMAEQPGWVEDDGRVGIPEQDLTHGSQLGRPEGCGRTSGALD
jgi:hypothetical protein